MTEGVKFLIVNGVLLEVLHAESLKLDTPAGSFLVGILNVSAPGKDS